LHERLAKEGLFDPALKRPLPRFPRTVALITSPTGAAIRDFLEVLRRRWKGTRVLVIPARMQGEHATREVVEGLRLAGALLPPPDVVVVARGGGSIDDLECFNREAIVRAIRATPTPVVSAIGHDIDVTLADLAADLRALTPTEAAEHIVPSGDEIRRALGQFEHRLHQRLRFRLREARARLERLAERPVLRRPYDLVRQRQRQVDELGLRLSHVVRRQTRDFRQKLEAYAARLDSLSPLAVLGRGYSLTRAADGRLVRDSHQVQPGDTITTQLAAGTLQSRVEHVRHELAPRADTPPAERNSPP
jgi:exodeoxyribonuclease VII large subunit